MKRARVLLADDHSLMLDGIRSLLKTNYTVVGTVGDGNALVAAAILAQWLAFLVHGLLLYSLLALGDLVHHVWRVERDSS